MAGQWNVILDGVLDATFPTRKEARLYIKYLRNHPARRDRVTFGHGGNVSVVRGE